MLINTRKILASIGLLIAFAGWPCSSFCESITISYNDTFSPSFPISGGNADTTNHTVNNFKFGAAGIYKGDKANYLMFASGKGYLYNTESLGHIDSVIVSYSAGVSTSAKYGVYFADSIMFKRISSGNKSIKGKSASDTVTNNNAEIGGYFQLSTSSANCQIVSIKIVYTQDNTTPPEDIIPPVFSSNYPKAEDIATDSFNLKVKASEPCTVFYQVVVDEESAPSVNDLLTSDSTITVAAGNTEYSATVAGLDDETTYYVYLIAKDTADNVQENITNFSVTTASATQRTIALRDIGAKYYWGEMANIKWTATNFDAATDLDSILIFKDNDKILSYSIDITSGEADILIGNGTAPNKDTYATTYSLKVVSGNVESEMSESFTIVPVVTINQLLTDTTTRGVPNFKDKIVKVKGLITGSKLSSNKTYKNFTLQDGDSVYCSIYVNYCYDTIVATGDSVFAEGKFNISSNDLYRIGSSTTNTSTATKINSNNNLPAPQITTITIAQTKPLMNSLIKIVGVNCDKTKSCFYIGEDTIYYKETLYTGNLNPLNNRKYDISGVLGRGTGKRYEIWPRSEADLRLYSNDTTLANLIIGGRDALDNDALIFNNLNIIGIIATANNSNATISIRINNDTIATTSWANVSFSPLDSVFVTVTAEDGSAKTYKRIIDCKTFIFSPLANNSFETGDIISFSWTSHNIDEINLVLDIQSDTILLTNSAISADLGGWQYTVPNTMFGNGKLKALRNGIALDSLTVTITDTRAPAVIRRSPAIGASDVRTSLYVSMVFDEPVSVADNAKLIVGDLEFPITAIGDTAAKAFVSGISYDSTYVVSLSDNAIRDLAGNNAVIGDWTFTTRTTPLPDLYFSEYAKGSSNNKYYEIYNPCDTAVDLSHYFVTMDEFKTSSRNQVTLQLSGWLMPNEVLVVAYSGAPAEVKRMVDVSTTKTTNFTGDDLLGLFRKNGDENVLIDVLGPFGNCDMAANWAVAGIENASANNTIVRDVVIRGTTDWAESAGTDSLDSQWTVLDKDDFSSLGRHGVGHGTEIMKMSIGGIAATIDDTKATVSIDVPYGTDLTEMAVTYRISQGARMLVGEISVGDTLNLSQPVVATIIAGDSIGQKSWTISVNVGPRPSSKKDILSFTFVETTPLSVSIDTTNATIDAVVAYNLDSLVLTPVITISADASVPTALFSSRNGKRTAKSGWDFSIQQTITVTAQDLSQKVWHINVEKEPEPHLTFSQLANNSFETGDTIRFSWTSYNIDGIDLVLDIQSNTIQLTNSTISADLGEWQYTVPNSMFGNGLIKAVKNDVALDSLEVTIADTRAPAVIRRSPANGDSDVRTSLYVSMVFDEPVSVADNAKLIVGDLEFPITAVGDTAAKAFVSGIDYGTAFEITLSNGAICDLAGNNAIIGDWSFTTKSAPQPDLYFSEYAKGSSNNKYYEIYNPCDTAVDLSHYFVTMDEFKTSSRNQVTLQLSGWLMPNEVLVVAYSGAPAEVKRMVDVSTTKTTNFTGDDLLGLFRKNGDENVLIDVLGPFGNCDMAANWAVAGIENASANNTIVRDVVIRGTTDWAESAGTDSLDSQWTVLDKDDFSSLGRHGVGHGTEIMKMSIGGIAATIDDTKATVSIDVPYGTDLTEMAVTYRISQGARMLVGGIVAGDTLNLSQPVVATVIAGDNIGQKNWTISVNVGPRPSSEKDILSFTFVEATPISVTIDTTNATIDAVVAYNLDSLVLTPVITISADASVPTALFSSRNGKRTAKNGWDFSVQQTITVTAQDLSQKVWHINVEKEPEPHLTFSPLASNSFETGDTIRFSWTSYNIDGIDLVLDIQNNTIQLTDSAISADLGEWQYTVPNSMFGNGKLKALRNGIALDSLIVTIADTRAPAVIRRSPAIGASDVRTSLYVSMVFDEPVSVADNANLLVGNLEFPITTVCDTTAKAFVSGINYDSTYQVSLSDDAIRDLAGNNAVIGDWTFTTKATPQPDLYFSEYAKGSGSNKYYEIYNPCDTAVDLSCYFVTMDNFSSSSRSQTTLQLSGWLLPDEVLVVANSSAAAEIKRMTDVSTTKTTNFTGDDLLGLFKKDGGDTVLIDVLGPFGNCDVAANWAAAGTENASTNHTIVRNVVIRGTTDWNESAGTDSLDSQWTVLDKDDFSSLGRHSVGHGTEILKMSIGGIAATIDGTEANVSVDVPYGTNLTEMAVTYRISQSARMVINDEPATDTIDFSQPITATIIAGDSVNRKDWAISVNVGPKPSSDNSILSFSFVETSPVSVTIDTANATIDAIVAYNLDSLKLTPIITIAEFASVSSTLFKSSKGKFTAKTRWNFDEPQTITVTAQDLSQKVWHINVEKEPEPHLTFSQLANNSFETGDTIRFSWTSHNIDEINLVLDIQGTEIQLTDSAISADLGEWQYTVPNTVFGNGKLKALRNGIALDSLEVYIADTRAPAIVRQSPTNGSEGVNNSLYINIVFDEPVSIADNAKLIIGDFEFPITAVGDTAAKAFVSGISYDSTYQVSLSDNAIRDLAENNAVIGDWSFTTRTTPQPDLYFSEYAKGSSNNKYYEIYNPCDTAVDLSCYFVTMDNFSSSSRSQASLQLSGWLLPDEVLVVANSSAAAEIKRMADVSTTKTTNFTGDDLLGLFRKDGGDTVLIDVLGPFGNCEVAANWAAAGISNASTNHTIVRNVIICGTTYWTESAGTDSLDSQWTVLDKDDFSSLGRHGIGHGTEILKMSIGGIAATIDSTERIVSIDVPYGTDLAEMTVTYRISQGAQMLVGGIVTGDTLNLSQPVVATVIAGDSIGQKNWTISVNVGPRPSSEKDILSFTFVEATPLSVSIDTTNSTIDAVMAFNLDSLILTPVITIAEFASVSSTLFKSSKGKFTAKTRWNFDEPQTITVTAQDLSQKVWHINVEKEPEPHLTFSPLASNSFETSDIINFSWTSYNIDEIDLALDIQNNTIHLNDSSINADLGEWQYTVPNTMFGNGLIKALRNGIALDSLEVSIADTRAPAVIRRSPANGDSDVRTSLYVSMVFDEPVSVADNAKLIVGDLEFPITAVGDTAAKAFVSGISYDSTYVVSLSNNAILDLAGNNAVIGNWTFTTRTAPQPDLYFSEYAKGSSNNKYYEIYNPCDTAVDLSCYFVMMDNFSSSSRSQASLQLSGWLLPDEVLVVANSSAAAEIKRMADVSTTKTTNFTGDDILGLFGKNGSDTVLIDVLGPFGNCDVAANWAAAGVANASTNHTIVRNVVIRGTTEWAESAGTDSLDSQWTVLGENIWTSLGRHGVGHGTEILKMSIGGVAATIDSTERTVSVDVPYGTDLTEMAVTYRISQGARMLINDEPATDTIDFSQPITATIIAGDSVNRKDWAISVNVGPKPSSDNSILSFSFVETSPVSVTIDTANATIDAVVAYNLDSLKLTPVITIAEFASVSSTLFKSSKGIFTAKTKWDFNEPKTITVKAEDLTEKVWNVRVEREKTQELTIKDIAKLDGGLIANVGKPIITEGIVTHIVITAKGAELYIQDSAGMWSGIMVVDEDNIYAATLAIGDRIKISGIVEENFGMARIGQIEAITVLNSDIKIHTDTIIVEDALSVAYQNALVTIDSVVCTSGFENLFAVSDSTNSILIYNKYRISDFALEIDSMYRITGIVYYTSADNSYRIIPRSADDIVKLVRPLKPEQTKPEEQKPEEQKPEEQKPQEPDTTTVGIAGTTHIGLTAYTIGRTIVVENADATVTVFDIAGRLIATARPARRIAISAPHSGIYIVGTRQGAIKVRVD